MTAIISKYDYYCQALPRTLMSKDRGLYCRSLKTQGLDGFLPHFENSNWLAVFKSEE